MRGHWDRDDEFSREVLRKGLLNEEEEEKEKTVNIFDSHSSMMGPTLSRFLALRSFNTNTDLTDAGCSVRMMI